MFRSAVGTQTDNTSVRSRTRYQLSHPAPLEDHITPILNRGDLLPTGGIVGKGQPMRRRGRTGGGRGGQTDGKGEED